MSRNQKSYFESQRYEVEDEKPEQEAHVGKRWHPAVKYQPADKDNPHPNARASEYGYHLLLRRLLGGPACPDQGGDGGHQAEQKRDRGEQDRMFAPEFTRRVEQEKPDGHCAADEHFDASSHARLVGRI